MRDLLPSTGWRGWWSLGADFIRPVAVVADATSESTLRRDLVLDGFHGSGRTMNAAGRSRRGCYGLDHYSAQANVSSQKCRSSVSGKPAKETGTTEG